MVHCDGKWELHEERRVRYNSVLPSSMYSNPAFQSPFFFFFLINCACTISHVPWIVRNPSTREGREGLLYLTLRSSCNSHFPSQCTIACEMGNCISELRARYNSVCSKRWPNSFMFTKTWPQPSPQLASRSLNGGDTLSHTSKEQDLFKWRVSQPVCRYHWHWVMSGETNLYRAVCVCSPGGDNLLAIGGCCWQHCFLKACSAIDVIRHVPCPWPVTPQGEVAKWRRLEYIDWQPMVNLGLAT